MSNNVVVLDNQIDEKGMYDDDRSQIKLRLDRLDLKQQHTVDEHMRDEGRRWRCQCEHQIYQVVVSMTWNEGMKE